MVTAPARQWAKSSTSHNGKPVKPETIEDRERVRTWVLAQDRPVSTMEIVRGTGIPPTRIQRLVTHLYEQGLIVRRTAPACNGALWGSEEVMEKFDQGTQLPPPPKRIPNPEACPGEGKSGGRPVTQGNLEARETVLTFVLAQSKPVLMREIVAETGIAAARVNRFLAYLLAHGKIGRQALGSPGNGSLWGSLELMAQYPPRHRHAGRGRPRRKDGSQGDSSIYGCFAGQGEAGLLAAVLANAKDALFRAKDAKARQEVMAWFTLEPHPGEDPFSFRRICLELDLDPEYILQGILARAGGEEEAGCQR